MRPEEARLAAAVKELHSYSAKITDTGSLADLDVIIDGFETMRPYVSVGLKVCPSIDTLEAITRLHESGLLNQDLSNTLTDVVQLGRKRDLLLPAHQMTSKSCRAASVSLGRSFSYGSRVSCGSRARTKRFEM